MEEARSSVRSKRATTSLTVAEFVTTSLSAVRWSSVLVVVLKVSVVEGRLEGASVL